MILALKSRRSRSQGHSNSLFESDRAAAAWVAHSIECPASIQELHEIRSYGTDVGHCMRPSLQLVHLLGSIDDIWPFDIFQSLSLLREISIKLERKSEVLMSHGCNLLATLHVAIRLRCRSGSESEIVISNPIQSTFIPDNKVHNTYYIYSNKSKEKKKWWTMYNRERQERSESERQFVELRACEIVLHLLGIVISWI